MSGISREGHRQRLRDSYIENGTKGMSLHNVLELMLTYSVPRRDVKEIAYSLYNFANGDINKILSANYDELLKIDGIGENSATLIRLFADIPAYINARRKRSGEIISGYAGAKEYARKTFSSCTEEALYEISADNSGKAICVNTVYQGRLDPEKIKVLDIIKYAIKNRASSIILVHAKPGGSYEPDENDKTALCAVAAAFRALEIRFSDYIIVGNDGTFSSANDIRFVGNFMKY